jgi:CheY-like chemotaxis protein
MCSPSENELPARADDRILLVDDDERIRDVYGQMPSRDGHAIVFDLAMPLMNGLEFLSAIRRGRCQLWAQRVVLEITERASLGCDLCQGYLFARPTFGLQKPPATAWP